MNWLVKSAFALVLLMGAGGTSLAQIQVFVAASLIDVMGEAGADFEAQTGVDVTFIHAGSSTLAHQIVAGAPADIFISANANWLSFVQEKTSFGMRNPLFSNQLVVIARADSEIELETLSELSNVLGEQRLALGDPNHVPAGIYAQQALQSVQVWNDVANRLAPAANVRDALQLVAAGAAPLGIVYASDSADNRVRVINIIDTQLHEEIIYWGAIGENAGADARAFFDYLQSERMNKTALEFGCSAYEGD